MTEDVARREAKGVTPTSEIALDHGAGRSSAVGAGATFAAGTRRRAEERRRQAGYLFVFGLLGCFGPFTEREARSQGEHRTRVPRTVRGVEDITESGFLCAVFLFCTRDGGTSLGTTFGRGDEASLPAAGFYARSQRRVRGNTRPCFEGALTREAGAPIQNGRAPPPGGWWRKGECLGKVSRLRPRASAGQGVANTLEDWHRART